MHEGQKSFSLKMIITLIYIRFIFTLLVGGASWRGERSIVSQEIERFEDLDAWKEARNLTREVYRLSGLGDFSRDLELKSRTRRSAVSIMFHLSTGFVLRTSREFRNYLIEALGATAAVEVALYIALDQRYISQAQFKKLYDMTERVSAQIQDLMRFDVGG